MHESLSHRIIIIIIIIFMIIIIITISVVLPNRIDLRFLFLFQGRSRRRVLTHRVDCHSQHHRIHLDQKGFQTITQN